MNLGQIKRMTINLEKPIKMEMLNMDYRELMILVGMNGTGKTLVLKLTWFMSMAAKSGVILSQPGDKRRLDPAIGGKGAPIGMQEVTQYLFDHVFEDPTNFTGEIQVVFENGSFTVSIKDGKIVEFHENFALVTEAATPIYMSSQIRLYSQMDQYLALRSKCEHLDEMNEFYRLYDLTLMEAIIRRSEKGWKVSERVKRMLDDMGEFKVDVQEILIEDNKFKYVDSKGDKHFLGTLGNGHQAMLNMAMVTNFADGDEDNETQSAAGAA